MRKHTFYQDCAYFTAARYMRSIEKLASSIFRPTQLKPAYSYIMLFLEDQKKATIMEIAHTLGYDRSTVSRMTKVLTNQGYILPNEKGREIEFAITQKGEKFLKTANSCLNKLDRTTSQLLGVNRSIMTNLLTANNKRIDRCIHE